MSDKLLGGVLFVVGVHVVCYLLCKVGEILGDD